MGNLCQSWMLDILRVLQLPGNVEGDMNGPSTDIKCRSDVALQLVTHHEELRGLNLQTLTELRELCFGFITSDLYM